MEAVSLDNPLGADAYVLDEETLQRPCVQANAVNNIVDAGNFGRLHNALDDAPDLGDILIPFRQPLAEEVLSDLDHPAIFFLGHDCVLEHLRIDVKDYLDG